MPSYLTRALRSNDRRYGIILDRLGYTIKESGEVEKPKRKKVSARKKKPVVATAPVEEVITPPQEVVVVDDDPDNDGMSAKQAAAELLRVADNLSNSTFKRRAAKILGDDVPNRRADIMEALKAV